MFFFFFENEQYQWNHSPYLSSRMNCIPFRYSVDCDDLKLAWKWDSFHSHTKWIGEFTSWTTSHWPLEMIQSILRGKNLKLKAKWQSTFNWTHFKGYRRIERNELIISWIFNSVASIHAHIWWFEISQRLKDEKRGEKKKTHVNCDTRPIRKDLR